MKIERVGVIGAGNIGIGVLTDLILHGINTVAVDLSEEVLAKAQAAILKNVKFAPFFSKSLPRLTPEVAGQHLTLTTELEALSSCDFIIENVTENWAIKEQVYHRIDQIARPEVCFGVNTSCISITRVAAATKRPEQVLGMHLMNPVHLKPTVEVIRGFHTSEQTMKVVSQLFLQLEKKAIVVEDFPGFVSNRISHLFMNEAALVLQDQVASAEKIDQIFKQCFGHKMGPLETADLIGLDTVMHSLDVLYESYHDPKYRCCPLLQKMVYAGHLGRKSGHGFYDYPEP